jgi:hypothetical protein
MLHATVTHITRMSRVPLLLRALLTVASLACAQATALQAQEPGPDSTVPRSPYSSLDAGIGVTRVVAPGSLGTDWDASSGVRVDVHTPFHVGELGASVSTMRFDARSTSQPDFRAWLIGIDWRVGIPSPRWIRPRLALTVGDFLTVFDGVEVKGMAKESEVFIGGSVDLEIPIAGATSATIALSGLQVLTSTPIRLGIASAGIAHSIATPRWMRKVIE